MNDDNAVELYRRHRPQRFRDVLGQDDAVRVLEDMVKRNKMKHAIMFSGPSGCGKTTLARILKSKLECSDGDFYEINAADARGIDTIRDIRQHMGLAPRNGKCRIWLLDESHRLTGDGQSSLLKLLEDTPSHVYFFLCTTDPNKLLLTIRTRCTPIHLTAIDANLIEKLVKDTAKKEGKELSEDVAGRIVEIAEGSARKAMVLLDQILHLETEEQQLDAIMNSDSRRQAIEIAKALFNPTIKWPQMAKILASVEEDPESLRYMILGYARKVLLGGGKMASRAATIIMRCEEPWYNGKGASLALACWDLLNGK